MIEKESEGKSLKAEPLRGGIPLPISRRLSLVMIEHYEKLSDRCHGSSDCPGCLRNIVGVNSNLVMRSLLEDRSQDRPVAEGITLDTQS